MDRMSRGCSPAFLAALARPVLHPVVLAHLDWPDDPVHAHSGVGDIQWAGQTWIGVGEFGTLSAEGEGMSGVPVDFSVGVAAPLPEIGSYAGANIRRRSGRLYLGLTTEAGSGALIDAVEIVSGTMDGLNLGITSAPERLSYDLTVGFTTGPSMRAEVSAHHSHEDQSRKYPGDTAGKKLIQAQTRAEKTRWPE